MEKSRKPKIRFKGYNDDWEQRKVGELLIERNQQAPMSEEYPLMAFVANEGVTPKGERYDRSALVTDTKNKLYKKTEFGDFIYSSNNLETGSIGLNKYGKACISPVYSIFKPIDIADSDFLGRRLVRKDFINTMVKWRQGVIYGQWRIHESDFLNIDILVPVTDEQQRIGKLLDDIDHLITLHQRKLDKLVNVKKSMLEKMFPKQGSTVPEVRFSGFTEDWEQRKVGDFLTESRIRGNTGLDAKKLTVKLWGKGVVEKNDFGGSEHTQYFTRRKGQFIYSKLDFLNSAFGVIPEKLDNYESTADLPAFDLDGMNPYFMYFVAIQESFYLKHGSIADGSRKAKRIHADTFLNMPVMVPTIDEQNLIVDFVQHLDNIITLHQRKLEKLKNIKKSMLEKMFI